MSQKEQTIERLQRACALADQSLKARTRSIVEANQAGLSVRQIAAACGLSSSRVHQLLTEAAAVNNKALASGEQQNENKAHLRRVALFAGIDDETLNSLAEYAKLRNFPKGAVFIQEGDSAESMYIILSGKVEVYLNEANGKEVILNSLGVGDCIGELSLLDQQPRSASVRTITACKMLALTRAAFVDVIESQPGVALELLALLAAKVRDQTTQTRDLALKSSYQRLVAAFHQLGQESEGKLILDDITHQRLADHIHASREMVTRIINDLKKGGYIEVGRRQLVVKKRLPALW